MTPSNNYHYILSSKRINCKLNGTKNIDYLPLLGGGISVYEYTTILKAKIMTKN